MGSNAALGLTPVEAREIAEAIGFLWAQAFGFRVALQLLLKH